MFLWYSFLVPVHCEYEKWSPYKNCSVECGGGEQFRTRGIAQAAAYGGTECDEDLKEKQSCNEQPCPGIPSYKIFWNN